MLHVCMVQPFIVRSIGELTHSGPTPLELFSFSIAVLGAAALALAIMACL